MSHDFGNFPTKSSDEAATLVLAVEISKTEVLAKLCLDSPLTLTMRS